MGELPAGYLPVEGSDRPPLPDPERVGPADPRQRVTVSVRLRRRPDAPPLPRARRAPGTCRATGSRPSTGPIPTTSPGSRR
jgi:hypothetical protein